MESHEGHVTGNADPPKPSRLLQQKAENIEYVIQGSKEEESALISHGALKLQQASLPVSILGTHLSLSAETSCVTCVLDLQF